MVCVADDCPRQSFVLADHRIAVKNCLLTTRAAKWATVQVGMGRTVLEVAGELDCDWHTVNDAVHTYGEALLLADRRPMNNTSAIGLDETSFVRLEKKGHTDYATTVADLEHHQIIEILPSRDFVEVARWLDKQPKGWKERIEWGALDMSNAYAAVYSVVLPKADQVSTPSTSSHSPTGRSIASAAASSTSSAAGRTRGRTPGHRRWIPGGSRRALVPFRSDDGRSDPECPTVVGRIVGDAAKSSRALPGQLSSVPTRRGTAGSSVTVPCPTSPRPDAASHVSPLTPPADQNKEDQ